MTDNIGFILNVISLVFGIFACLISFIIFIFIIHHICYNRVNQDDKIVVTLCLKIYVLTFILSAILISLNTQTFVGDLYEQNFNSSWCIFMGYFTLIAGSMFFWSFINQAFYRLCRIVYPTYRYLQYLWLYIILSPIQSILITLFLCPILIWHDIIYLSEEYYCFVPFTNLRSLPLAFFIVYGIPCILLSLIYLRITIFLRRQPHNQTFLVKQRQQRDLLVLRRILIMVGFMLIVGSPVTVFLIIFYITGKKIPFFERSVWLSLNLSVIILTIALLIITPQLKSMVLKKFQRNRIMPMNGISINPIRHYTITR